MSAAMTEYPKCIAEKLAELDAQRDKALALVALVRMAEEVSAKFQSESVKGFVDSFVSIPSNRVVHYFRMQKSMDEVLPVLHAYRALGAKSLRFEDDPEHGNRTYHLSNGIQLYVIIPVGEQAGASCKFVPVGTKTVPVYELKCDGEASNG